MDKNKKYQLEAGSIRKRIYDLCLRNADGLTTDDIIAKLLKSKTADFGEAAICHNLLNMVREKIYLTRVQKPNPTTGRPCFYYVSNPEPKIPVSAQKKELATAA